MPQVLRDCKLIVGKYDMSGKMNALALNATVEQLDDTVFGDDTKSSAAGLKAVEFQHEGLFDTGTDGADDVFYNNLAVADTPVIISPDTLAEGNLAYFFKSLQSKYSINSKVGQLLSFSVGGSGRGSDLVRGKSLLNGTKTATGNSTPIQLGAVSSVKKLFAALHILAASGGTPSLTVKVQSSATSGGTYVDRLTFAAQNAAGAVWGTPTSGPVTDTWWRINYTISGSTPSFNFIVPVGIQ